jgi:Fe2+ or Zn2+ uptake regulation protein
MIEICLRLSVHYAITNESNRHSIYLVLHFMKTRKLVDRFSKRKRKSVFYKINQTAARSYHLSTTFEVRHCGIWDEITI